MHQGGSSAEGARGSRLPGLLLLLGIVAIGGAAGAGYFRWAAPRARERAEERLAGAPATAEGRLEVWVEFAEPIVLERLRQARISAQQPWIVTYAVEDPGGGPPEAWGIATDELARGVLSAEGLRAVVRLPQPRLLARAELVGDHARSVPTFSPDERPRDPGALLSRIAEFALRHQREKLEKDIRGASLVVEITGDGSSS